MVTVLLLKSNITVIGTIHSLEGLMLKLKLQYFGHLMQELTLWKKTLMLEKVEGRRRKGVTEDWMVG